VIWSLIGLALMILEFILPGLVVFFFGLGALLVAVLCAVMEPSLNLQLVVFMAASVALFVTLRRFFREIFAGDAGQVEQGQEDRNFTGSRVRVVEAIQPPATGKVELNGTLWNADAPEALDAGDWAEVVSRHNLVLNVRKV
jgi:membrane protein implicated in regulation of membrane protease activity